MAALTAPAPRRFRPSLWPTVMTLVCLPILVALGTWQLERMSWKQDLIDRIEERMSAAPTPLPARIDDPQAWEYRRVSLTGTFRHDQEMPVTPRTYQGKLGYHLVTPLDRPDGTTVLVDRGWVPVDRRDQATRPETLVQGTVTLEGLGRITRPAGWLQPESEPEKNAWYHVDADEMARHIGRPVSPVYVDAAMGPDPQAFPIGGRTIVSMPNNHLQYVVTWYGLAATLLVIYVVSQWRRPGERG